MKLKDYLEESKIIDDEVHFDSVGGYFSGVSSRLIYGTGDNEFTVSPGVTNGGKYPIYKIMLDKMTEEEINNKLKISLKKAADAMDKVLASEMKKLGFKRIR